MIYLKLASSLLLFTSISAFSADTADSNSDKYPYIDTPTADQHFDLLDDDNDGVINARDLCPGTPPLASINNDGCGTYSKSTEEKKLHILFANNSSDINPIFLSQINEMANFLKEYPTTTIELSGYASKTGDPQKNLKLSTKRAIAVQSKLVEDGIDIGRIKIIGYGDRNLEALGNDPVSLARNRRVKATVKGYKGEISKRWTIFTLLPRQTKY